MQMSRGEVMNAFRVVLVVLFTGILVYTAVVMASHGPGLFTVFFGDIMVMGWPGQFNVDFLGFLTLSALWLSWRHHFSPVGIAPGVLGFFGGGLVFTAYLFLASLDARGDVKTLLLGKVRAG
jgi:hypothetical protein